MYKKYPRTPHLPWSHLKTRDDLESDNNIFNNKKVVVTEKMDGENTTMYRDKIYARSSTSRHHASQSCVKNFWSQIAHNIPPNWRVCGENMFATHTIHYKNLPSVFLGFSVWNDQNVALNWDETISFFETIGVVSVPVLYVGLYDPVLIQNLRIDGEGYVVRVFDEIKYPEFKENVAKFVRFGFERKNQNWINPQLNKLTVQ